MCVWHVSVEGESTFIARIQWEPCSVTKQFLRSPFNTTLTMELHCGCYGNERSVCSPRFDPKTYRNKHKPHQVINLVTYSLYWQPDSRSGSVWIPFCGTWMFITMFRRSRHLSCTHSINMYLICIHTKLKCLATNVIIFYLFMKFCHQYLLILW